jgi:hypothetical protein
MVMRIGVVVGISIHMPKACMCLMPSTSAERHVWGAARETAAARAPTAYPGPPSRPRARTIPTSNPTAASLAYE